MNAAVAAMSENNVVDEVLLYRDDEERRRERGVEDGMASEETRAAETTIRRLNWARSTASSASRRGVDDSEGAEPPGSWSSHHSRGISYAPMAEETKQEIQPPRQDASYHYNDMIASNDSTDERDAGPAKKKKKSTRKSSSSRSHHHLESGGASSRSIDASDPPRDDTAAARYSTSNIAYYPPSDDEAEDAVIKRKKKKKKKKKKHKQHSSVSDFDVKESPRQVPEPRPAHDTTNAHLSEFEGQDVDESVDVEKGLTSENVAENTYAANVETGSEDVETGTADAPTAEQNEGSSLLVAEQQVDQDSSNEADVHGSEPHQGNVAARPTPPGAVRILPPGGNPLADWEGSVDEEESRGGNTIPEAFAEYVDHEEEERRMEERVAQRVEERMIRNAPFAHAVTSDEEGNDRNKNTGRQGRRWVVIAAVVFAFFGIALGASLGIVLRRQQSNDPSGATVEATVKPSQASSTQAPTISSTSTTSTKAPAPSPTSPPTQAPTPSPTSSPTQALTPSPTSRPTQAPTPSPTSRPTQVPTPSPTSRPTQVPTPSPTSSPTQAPTPSPISPPTQAPTPSPISALQALIDLLSQVSFDGGVALQTPGTPQNSALLWLAADANLNVYSNERIIQRYVLATVYYSMQGDGWINNDNWLDGGHECLWWQQRVSTFVSQCASTGLLFRLELYRNNLAGSIPPEIGLLSNSLELLLLIENALTGTIPRELGTMTKLTSLWITENFLTGTIPTELSLLTANLATLGLRQNSLTEKIPTEMGLMTNLDGLYLGENDLTGRIPRELGKLTKLTGLGVEDNSLTETIPTELGLLTSLEGLWLQRNDLTGIIPSELRALTKLTSLSLYQNSLMGTIPTELVLLTNLAILDLSINKLTGTVPSTINQLTNLEYLVLYDNMLTGAFTCPTYIENCWVSCNILDREECRSLP